MPASQTERETILALVRERILAYAASRAGRDAAEDLAQDTLLLLDTKYGHLDSKEDLVPLAVTIMKFKIRELHNRDKEKDHASLEGDRIAGGGYSPESDASCEQLRESILRHVERLGARCREIFLLKLEGYNFIEIGARMGAKTNTIYTWDLRCRAELRKLMGYPERRA